MIEKEEEGEDEIHILAVTGIKYAITCVQQRSGPV